MDCHICQKTINGQYYYDIWEHKICASHINNDVEQCSSCSAFTKKENVLTDGRILCDLCISLSVKPNTNIDVLKNKIVTTLAKVGFAITDSNNIPIEIVSARRLANITNSNVKTPVKGYASHEYTTYSSFSKIKNKSSFKIYILTYLTRIEFAGVLAHEMLHIWQFQNNIKLSEKITEGFCNMGSYLIYDLYLKQNINNPPYDKLSKIFIDNLHKETDPIYGDGFRQVYKYYESFGWNNLKKNILKHKIQ
jgi:hypothetical protein